MVRPTKIGTNLLCIDIGRERKEAFSKAIANSNKSITEAIREHMDSVIEEQKKGEAPGKGIPIINANSVRQSCITEYDIKLFQRPEERFQNLMNLDKINREKVARDVCYLQSQIAQVRIKTR